MPGVVTTRKASTVGQAGTINFVLPQYNGVLNQRQQLFTPEDDNSFNITDTRPTSVSYENRWYAAGLATDNVMVDEYYRCHRLGIVPPIVRPAVAAAAGPGVTGTAICYLVFYDEMTGERSPLSGASASVVLANQSRAWTSLPTTSQDYRVSHIEGWVSMNGALPRRAWRRQLGVTAVTETVSTASLQEAHTDDFERFPRGAINTIFHERHVIAGVFDSQDTLYVSAIGYYERYEGLSFKTKSGEKIVGFAHARRELLVFTPINTYVLRGYTESDLSFEPLDPDIGCCNHHMIGYVHGDPWWPDAKGIWMYNGGFHLMSRDIKNAWQRYYEDNREEIELGFAVVDKNEHTYELYMTPGEVATLNLPTMFQSSGTLVWVASFIDSVPSLSGEYAQPNWSFDIYGRDLTGGGNLGVPGGTRSEMVLGSTDGWLREKDVDDADDDTDSIDKTIWIRLKHFFMGTAGGPQEWGKLIKEFWSYLTAENDAWTLYLHGGDEDAYKQQTPDNILTFWKDDVAASALTVQRDINGTTYNIISVPKNVHFHEPQQVQGRGVTPEWKIPNPDDTVRWLGFGGYFKEGVATRPPASVTPIE